MALVLKDRVQETGTANTTVSFTLAGAVTGYQSFSVVGNTNTTYYAATDGSGNWESGLGTYSTTGPTLTRTTILASSNSGSAVTFSGTVTVFLTYPSSRALYLDGTSANINVSQAAFTANGIPYASSTSALATGSALTFNGTNLTTTGSATAASFNPTSATAPTAVGMYRLDSTTFGFSTNSTNTTKIGTGGIGTGTSVPNAVPARVYIDTIGSVLNYTPTTTNAFGFYNAAGAYANPIFTATQINANSLKAPSLNIDDAVDPGTITTAATLYIENEPTGASITTITNPYALLIGGGTAGLGGGAVITGASYRQNTNGSYLSIGGANTVNIFGTSGSLFNVASTTITTPNTAPSLASSSGFGTTTFASTLAGSTITNAVTLYIEAAPAAGTNITITNAYSLYIASGASYFGGAVTTTGTGTFSNTTGNKLVVSGVVSQAAWTTTGPAISVASSTYTSSGGLTGTVAASSLGTPTFAATTLAQTVTNGATLYIAAAPSNGTNVTITNRYALYVNSGISYFGGAVVCNSNITLAAGTTSLAPIDFTAGSLLTSPVEGAMEFDGTAFYTTDDVTDGRGYLASIHYFRLAADVTAFGPAIGNFFGSTSGMNLDAGVYYEVEANLYFTKTTAGTVTFTMTFSNGPANNDAHYVGTPVGGIGTVGAPQTAAITKSTATAGALPVTGTLTTAVDHQYVLRSMFRANATTGGTFNIQITSSAGTVTPLTGSYYKLTRLPAANTGAFV
jgi:hypothetical protein